MPKKKTHEEHVAELAIKNPTVEAAETYSGGHVKIMHHCLIHDVYWKLQPVNALRGDGCVLCHKERIGNSNRMSHNQYVEAVKNINPTIIVVGDYVNARTAILHKCTVHNVEWYALPSNILRGCGCCECGNNKTRDKNGMTHDEYVARVRSINSDIDVVGKYINAKTPIQHRCKIDGYVWDATPDVILHGYGCPQCHETSGERQVRQWLVRHNINYKFQKSFDDCRDILPLPFDFYLPDYNVLIEYNGGQHYKPIEYFGGEENFKKQKLHDSIKNEYCESNNIRLLVIPYYANVEEELNNFLFI